MKFGLLLLPLLITAAAMADDEISIRAGTTELVNGTKVYCLREDTKLPRCHIDNVNYFYRVSYGATSVDKGTYEQALALKAKLIKAGECR